MIPGLYSAATALGAAAQNQEVIANNLANVTVPGYRRQGLSFEPFDNALTRASGVPLLGTQLAQAYNEFTPGPIQQTGNRLDLAIQGDGFFVINGPTGPVYTRSGVFTMDAGGQLQTMSGYPVAGEAGPITIPNGARDITITGDGRVMVDHSEVGRLQLAQFANPNQLVPVGPTLFQAPAGVAPSGSHVAVAQGYREGSNVQVASEMVRMIAGLRHYEASQRALRAMSDAIHQQTGPQSS